MIQTKIVIEVNFVLVIQIVDVFREFAISFWITEKDAIFFSNVSVPFVVVTELLPLCAGP